MSGAASNTDLGHVSATGTYPPCAAPPTPESRHGFQGPSRRPGSPRNALPSGGRWTVTLYRASNVDISASRPRRPTRTPKTPHGFRSPEPQKCWWWWWRSGVSVNQVPGSVVGEGAAIAGDRGGRLLPYSMTILSPHWPGWGWGSPCMPWAWFLCIEICVLGGMGKEGKCSVWDLRLEMMWVHGGCQATHPFVPSLLESVNFPHPQFIWTDKWRRLAASEPCEYLSE